MYIWNVAHAHIFNKIHQCLCAMTENVGDVKIRNHLTTTYNQ